MADDLTLKIAGQALSGWTEVRVTRGIERCPSDFDINLTEKYPGDGAAFVVNPGAACQVLIGSDVVVTGYVDKYMPSYGPEAHGVRITGRGKCQDLVDCSAEWPGGQISGTNALDVASKLAAPYGIKVSQGYVLGTPPSIPQFNLMLGESAYEIIERVCRFSSQLCYEDANGDLVLSMADPTKATGGVVEGTNVLAARGEFSQNERYSELNVFLNNVDTLQDIGNGGNLLGTASDPNIKRNRKKYVIAEAGTGIKVNGKFPLPQARAMWEVSRRAGRGQVLIATVDSWRDAAGTLWTPNTAIPIVAPNVKFPGGAGQRPGQLGEVTYYRDDKGTRAELTIMPPWAFTPELVLLLPPEPDLQPNQTSAATS